LAKKSRRKKEARAYIFVEGADHGRGGGIPRHTFRAGKKGRGREGTEKISGREGGAEKKEDRPDKRLGGREKNQGVGTSRMNADAREARVQRDK